MRQLLILALLGKRMHQRGETPSPGGNRERGDKKVETSSLKGKRRLYKGKTKKRYLKVVETERWLMYQTDAGEEADWLHTLLKTSEGVHSLTKDT